MQNGNYMPSYSDDHLVSDNITSVSYTHLDVYKRQAIYQKNKNN